ncbi:UDP-2,3-diacylglucosamine diphosphatase [Arenimonas sp. GDDSR-1]|uniref:UDP-2,3-diacylglucosamine diphosphatase n=1 Tax=Arenimonas sp. GDDSR-1 TaxID=2950125 RepID=UPI00262F123C|nr:UDP-2,3-diacylglucosamine diphosphatase [Arenimonas sp. GDDSR-1]
MSQIFISDLHLDAARPETTAQFLELLAGQCRSIEALYILGDLYEAWIGDDEDSALALQTQRALAACSASGTRIFVQRGNRDFLLGPAFAERIGAQLLPDYAVISCAGEPTLLMHGDLLCTEDREYLAFRNQVRNPVWQQHFLAQPLAARRAFAEQARQASQNRQQGLKDTRQLETITDVSSDAVLATMRRYGVKRLIHGHTHRPSRHALAIDGVAAERIVLGDWYTQSSHLAADGNTLNLHYLPAP